MKKTIALLAVLIAVMLVMTGCITIQLPEKGTAEPTSSAATEASEAPQETAEPQSPTDKPEATTAPAGAAGAPEGMEVVGPTTADAPAAIGQWVETKRYSAQDSAYHTVYFRIREVRRASGDPAVQQAIDDYNQADHISTFQEIENADLEYCMVEYEVYFPEDFPQADYGITSVDINFSVGSPSGGGIKANGMSYIGLSSVYDISDSLDINTFYAGNTYTQGKAIFAMVKGVSDYVFETYYFENDTKFSAFVQGK
ncbi:MAG: hypothetical protein PHD32_05735 [Eubacteriales bacterium]|nr:hypothetical protein [Eubacteriales bacterium]